MKSTATVISHGIRAGLHRMRPARLRHARRTPATRRRAMGLTGFAAALTLAVTLASPISPAMAIDYPTWDELQAAKSNTAAAATR